MVLRVISIAHTAVQRQAGRLRYHPLAADRSLDVHLVVPRRWHQFGRWMDADDGDDPGVTLHALPIRWPRAGRATWHLHHYRAGLGKLVAELAPDVIHLWEEPWSLVSLQALALRRLRAPRAALVLEVDQNILKRLPPPFEAIRRHVLRRTDLVLSRSEDATDVVRACGYQGPTAPIGYGVDQAVFHPTPPPSAAGEGCGGGTGGLRIGYVGRIVEEKGLDDALDAMAACPAPVPVTLAVLGEGPHQAALQRRADGLGLGGRVAFRGWAPPDQVADFIRSLDALVLLTRTTPDVREQFGRVVIEAQACGVPVIGSTSGAIPDVVGPGGWIVPERDPAALAALLVALAADRDLLRARGRAGREQVAQRFTHEVVARTLAEAWHRALSLRSRHTTP